MKSVTLLKFCRKAGSEKPCLISTCCMAATIFTLLIYSLLPGNINLRPDTIALQFVFFKEPFVTIIVIFLLKFVQHRRANPCRRREIRFLGSLPLNNSEILNTVLLQEIKKYIWIPALLLVEIISLKPVLQFPAMVRLFVMVFFLHIFCVFGRIAANFSALLRYGIKAKSLFPEKENVFISAIFTLSEAILITAAFIFPHIMSGLSFIIAFTGILLCISAAVHFLKNQFRQVMNRNFYYFGGKSHFAKNETQAAGNKRILRGYLPPFIEKEIIKLRKNSVRSSSVIMGLFCLGAYFGSLNNESGSDRVAVLLGLNVLFTIFYSFRSLSAFSPNEEPSEIIYSLPVKKGQIFFSNFLFRFLALGMTSLFFTLLLSASGIGTINALRFFSKSIFIQMNFITSAVLYGTGLYPDERRAKYLFLYWLTFLTALLVVAYPGILFILPITLLIPLIYYHKNRLFASNLKAQEIS